MQTLMTLGDAPMSRQLHRAHRAYRVARVVTDRRLCPISANRRLRPISANRRLRPISAKGREGVTLVLDGDLPAQPGQFVMAWLPGVEERPFSLMDDDPASLTVANVGPFTRALCALRPGDRLWLRGPYGHGFELVGRRHLLVGGGCGAAPLALLAKMARRQGHDVIAALGAHTADTLMLRWRFEALGCQLIVATDDGSVGHQGTVLEAVQQKLEARWPDAVYACGPEPMLLAVARRCQTLGLPCWVSMERVMKCGLGICGTCHFGDRLVCRDGPVFEGGEMLGIQESIEKHMQKATSLCRGESRIRPGRGRSQGSPLSL